MWNARYVADHLTDIGEQKFPQTLETKFLFLIKISLNLHDMMNKEPNPKRQRDKIEKNSRR